MKRLNINFQKTLRSLEDMQIFAAQKCQPAVANDLKKMIYDLSNGINFEAVCIDIQTFAFHWKGAEDVYFVGEDKKNWSALLKNLRSSFDRNESQITRWVKSVFFSK